MKFTFILAGLTLMPLATGCGNKKPPETTVATSSALDVTPPPVYTPAPTVTPVLAMPAMPEPMLSATPMGTTTSNYKVKKGDTLYAIARAHYGDGKQWSRIASANAGVTPQSLRVGQTLTLP